MKRALLVAAAVLAVAISLLLWSIRSRDKTSMHVSDVAGGAGAPAPGTPIPATGTAGASGAATGARPPGEPIDPGASFPAPSADQIAPRPERRPLSPGDKLEQRRAALDLVDDMLKTLESERAAAEASHDAETMERLRIRIERLRARRKVIVRELEELPRR